MNTIAHRLKATRLEKGWSQTHLAAEAGVSQSAIGNIESGLRQRPRELVSIARALGVLPEWLETGNGTKQPITNEIFLATGTSSARVLAEQIVLLAKEQRPRLRTTLAGLLTDLAEDPDNRELVEQTIADLERFFKR